MSAHPRHSSPSGLRLCLLLVLLVAGCAPVNAPEPTPAPVKIKIVNQPFFSFAPYAIAVEEGYFAEQGIDAELVSIVTSQDVLPALLSGDADVAAGLMSAGILNTISRGGDLVIVADKGYIDPNGCSNIGFVARASLHAQADPADPEVIRGKTVDIASGTWMEYYADRLLATVGLSVADVNKTALPSPQQLDGLTQSALDYSTNNEPWVVRFESAGHTRVLTPVSELLPNSQTAVMMFGPKLRGENAAVGERFMVAYLKAVRQYNEGKTDRNIAILGPAYNLDEDTLRAMCWPALHPNGTANADSMLDFQAWADAAGYVDAVLPIERIWDPRYSEYAVGVLGP